MFLFVDMLSRFEVTRLWLMAVGEISHFKPVF